jgi:hypothetical protein
MKFNLNYSAHLLGGLASFAALRFSFSREGAKTAKKAKNLNKTFFYLTYRFFLNMKFNLNYFFCSSQ